MPSAI